MRARLVRPDRASASRPAAELALRRRWSPSPPTRSPTTSAHGSSAPVVRYRAYSTKGLGVGEVGVLVAFCSFTFTLGIVTLADFRCCFIPNSSSASAARRCGSAGPARSRCSRRRASMSSARCCISAAEDRRLRTRLSAPADRRAAIARRPAGADRRRRHHLFRASAGRQSRLCVVLGVFLASFSIALISHAPGGLGVLEFAFLKAMPDAPQANVLAALLVFRLLYLDPAADVLARASLLLRAQALGELPRVTGGAKRRWPSRSRSMPGRSSRRSTCRTISCRAARWRSRTATRSSRWSIGWRAASPMSWSPRTGTRRATPRSPPRHPGAKPFETMRLSYGEQTLWPDHCVQGTPARRCIRISPSTSPSSFCARACTPDQFLFRLRRGRRQDDDRARGAARARGEAGFRLRPRDGFLRRHSALDARAAGFDTFVIEDACRAIDANGSLAAARARMNAAEVWRIRRRDPRRR